MNIINIKATLYIKALAKLHSVVSKKTLPNVIMQR